MNTRISVIAIQPLERMLETVRGQCKEIFKYTNTLQDLGSSDDEEDDDEDDPEDLDKVSEFALLERVVDKLGAIAELATGDQSERNIEEYSPDELLGLEFFGNKQVDFRRTSRLRQDAGSSFLKKCKSYVA